MLLAEMKCESPFLQPEWAVACDAADTPVEVMIFEKGGRIVGMLPFHHRLGHAYPVGDPLCDLQAVIAEPSLSIDWVATLKRARLKSFRFRHWDVCSTSTPPNVWGEAEFYSIDLSSGFEAYRQSSTRAKLRREIGRFGRRAEEALGAVEMQWKTRDQALLERLLLWKRRQSSAMGWNVSFAEPEFRERLQTLLRQSSPNLTAFMSALHFGGEPAAIEFYLQCRTRLHALVRAYNPEFSKFSPGNVLFWRFAEEAAGRGIARIDWGAGDEPFKHRFASDQRMVLDGHMDASPLRGALRAQARQIAKRLPSQQLRHWIRRCLTSRQRGS